MSSVRKSSSERRRTRSSALKHFTSVKRTRRSRTSDALRQRKSALIEATDERYFTPRGPFLYDVMDVDDGSPRARSIAYRGKYTDPKRPDGWISDTLAKVFTRGRQIGAGAQATVWEYDKAAWKIFKIPFLPSAVSENIDFLRANKLTGVVPKLLYSNREWGYIKMQLLHGYEPVAKDVAARSRRYRGSLLKAIAKARSKLAKDIRFGDLKKFDNIAVRHAPNEMVSSVKFYEGGTQRRFSDDLRAKVYVMEMASQLKITKDHFAIEVKHNKIKWLV